MFDSDFFETFLIFIIFKNFYLLKFKNIKNASENN